MAANAVDHDFHIPLNTIIFGLILLLYHLGMKVRGKKPLEKKNNTIIG
jgi:putative effector of murein hydrolase LrgA (UPF0299 family)